MLWSGDHLFPRVPETIDMLRKKGMVIVTVGGDDNAKYHMQANSSYSSPTTAPSPAPTTRRSSTKSASQPAR